MLGLTEDYTPFDVEIMVHINSALMHLEQLGVGPTPPLNIADNSTTWQQLTGYGTDLASAKDYIYLKVRTVFDPPAMSNVMDAFNKRIEELGWRLAVQAENNLMNQPVTIVEGGVM